MVNDNRESQGRPREPAPAIARVEAHVLRWPVTVPVRTSFGVMHDRPAVLVRIEDSDGGFGWGEAWCNFPACGAEHRARLIETVIAPRLVGHRFATPQAAFRELSEGTAVLAIQSGEFGPIAQAIAAIDIAMHDLAARRAGLPLWRHLMGADAPSDATATRTVPVYASGINPERPGERVQALRSAGYTAFKLKVGFGAERDVDNLAAVRAAAGTEAAVMVDANQAWDLETALLTTRRLAESGPAWLEEPLRADRPWSEWQRLAKASAIPLAAGENAGSDAAFDALIASRAIAVVQPDVAKWGGVSGMLAVVDRIAAAGLRFCPHYLGAGIGLAASMHVLASRGDGSSLLEVDANENPLRTLLCPALSTLKAGRIEIGAERGLGLDPEMRQLRAIARRA
jgi:D-galactarolactone cycloisomerase